MYGYLRKILSVKGFSLQLIRLNIFFFKGLKKHNGVAKLGKVCARQKFL